MNPDAFSPPPEGCEAFQQQISDASDTGAPLPPELAAHLRSCANCARFAETWFPEPPAALAQPVSVAADAPLRERILAAAAQPEIIAFPAPAARRTNWTAWMGRAAACLAFAGLAYWLLNPVPSQLKTPSAAVSAPTLGQSLARVEDHTKHEQEMLQTALVDGGQRVRGDVEWTMSALEL